MEGLVSNRLSTPVSLPPGVHPWAGESLHLWQPFVCWTFPQLLGLIWAGSNRQQLSQPKLHASEPRQSLSKELKEGIPRGQNHLLSRFEAVQQSIWQRRSKPDRSVNIPYHVIQPIWGSANSQARGSLCSHGTHTVSGKDTQHKLASGC